MKAAKSGSFAEFTKALDLAKKTDIDFNQVLDDEEHNLIFVAAKCTKAKVSSGPPNII